MNQRLQILIVLIVPVIFFILAIMTLSHYGINWDEPYHYRRGQAFLQYYLTGLKDYSNIPKYPALKGDSDNPDFRNGEKNFKDVQQKPFLSNPNFRRSYYQDDSWDGNYFLDVEKTYGHPPLNDILAALFNKIFYQKLGILGDLESYRLFIVFCVTFATIFIALFMWKEFGPTESFFSSLFFASYPLLVGEQHFNIKDPVEMSFFTITMLTAYWGIKKNKYCWFIVSSFFFALSFAVKFNILFSIPILFIWIIYFLNSNKKNVGKKIFFRNIILFLILTFIISLTMLIASYPTLWNDIANGILQILKFYKEVGYPVSQQNTRYMFGFVNLYPTVWIFYTTPPILLLLLLIAILNIKSLAKKNGFILFILIWVVVVIARNSLFGALSYGGVRLIMEFVPAIAMIAGIISSFIINLNKSKKYYILSFILILFLFTPTIIKLVKIHPNENVYFNFLIGGLAGAKAASIPSWGDSYGNAYYQGVMWLNSHAPYGALLSTPIGNISNIPRFKLRDDIALSPYYWSGLSHNGEYLIELTYDYPPINYFTLKYLNNAMIPIYEIKVDGVAIAKVWKNDKNHVKKEFSSTEVLSPASNINKKNNTLVLNLPTVKKIMKVNIQQPIKNCTPLKTGYVTTSVDGINWVREQEDIASDQLNREEPKKLSSDFVFYFLARDAKVIKFYTDNPDSCLLKTTKIQVTFL